MATVTACRDTFVAVCGIGKIGSFPRHWSCLYTGVGADVTDFATLAVHGNVVPRRAFERRLHVGHCKRDCGIGAVALCAIAVFRLRIHVNVGHQRHHGIVSTGMASYAGYRCDGNVIGRDLGASELNRRVALVTRHTTGYNCLVSGVSGIGPHIGMRVAGTMAIHAGKVSHLHVVEGQSGVPKLGHVGMVAAFARRIASRNVVDRHDRCRTRVDPAVTGDAVFGRSFENALQVAGFAAHVLVLCVEHKTGSTVVKVSARLLGLRPLGRAKLK